MATVTLDSQVRLRLQRLWKGTLFVGVAGTYAGLAASGLILFGWRPVLLAVLLVLLGQCFRYIANDIDRLGWRMGRVAEPDERGQIDAVTKRNQSRMVWLLGTLVLLPSMAVVVQVQSLAAWPAASVAAVALVFVELLYLEIRRVNRRTAFEEASYGLRDKGLFGGGPDSIRALAEVRTARVERQLDQLEAMADGGRISRSAYENARDKYRVELVMEHDPV